MIVYGINAVLSFLERSPELAQVLYLQVEKKDNRLQKLLDTAAKMGIPQEILTKKKFDQIVGEGVHQGVALKCREKNIGDEKSFKNFLEQIRDNCLILALDGIQDPHNLGACLRSAAAFGVDAVVFPKDNQAPITPVVRKSACGAVEVLNLFAVTNLSRALVAMKEKNIWIAGTVLDEKAQPLEKFDWRGSHAIVMGSEGAGLREGTQKQCDYHIYIPMSGLMQSLNVSVATGIILNTAYTAKALHR